MGNNVFAISTESTLQVAEVNTSTGTQKIDMVKVLFEYFFTTGHTLKEQNKFLLLFLQSNIQQNNIELLNRVLSEDALNDLHPSLLKSTLIRTENVSGIETFRKRAVEIFNKKIQAC